jgi:hypothetical protein
MSCSTDYSTLIDLFIQLVQSQAGKKIAPAEQWLHSAETLSVKLFRHLVSMQTLAASAIVEQVNGSTVSFFDYGSVKVVARAALETYLVLFYLYGSTDRAISEFRHKTWRLGGLLDRQKFSPLTAEHLQKLAREKQLIDRLRSEIEAAPQFQEYSPKQRPKLLEGVWRIGKGWSDLGVQAGFQEKFFKDVYGYLCGYSHSSYLSALQVGQAQSIEDQQKLTQVFLNIGVVIMAHFSFSYSSLFSSAASVLASTPEAKRIAEKWRFGPETMAALYNR